MVSKVSCQSQDSFRGGDGASVSTRRRWAGVQVGSRGIKLRLYRENVSKESLRPDTYFGTWSAFAMQMNDERKKQRLFSALLYEVGVQ